MKYTKIPGGFIGPRDEFEMNTKKMLLVSVERKSRQKLKLNLKTKMNNKMAWVRGINIIGEVDLDFLEKVLKKKFINRSYDEILNTNFEKLASRIPWTEN
ncbi:unnamed protein product [marine sediment metagenome]|uniref:Uncharacterized protein n=1 Tax=marine sediment metagenome TaxID=412755 RepID=X1M998_9ZZZZ